MKQFLCQSSLPVFFASHPSMRAAADTTFRRAGSATRRSIYLGQIPENQRLIETAWKP